MIRKERAEPITETDEVISCLIFWTGLLDRLVSQAG